MWCKRNARSHWLQLFDVPRDAGGEIIAAFGSLAVRYEARKETLSIPARMREVTWDQYQALLKALPDLRMRHSYDRGSLQCTTTSWKHERLKTVMALFIEHMTRSLGARMEAFGSAAFYRKTRRCGLEPDETYYIANEPAVGGKFELDLECDPPPDLALEIELRRPSMRRRRIYAALGVPELWTHDGSATQFHVLDPEGRYQEADCSLSFPFLAPDDIDRFLNRLSHEPTHIIVAFAKWAKTKHKKESSRSQKDKSS